METNPLNSTNSEGELISFERLFEDGNLGKFISKKSEEETLFDHKNGKCDLVCRHCYQEAIDWLEKQEETKWGEKEVN